MSLEGLIGGGDGIDCPYNNAASAATMGLLSGTGTAFSSPALSLALKSNKMEGRSEMPLMMENYDPSLLGRIRDEGHESRSGSDNMDGASGDDMDGSAPTATAARGRQSKRKKYHRHTPFQIQELESYFKINNHPDEKERLELGRRLSLESKQVKFWFQNRRTQMKTQSERQENNYLKRQNEELMIDNIRMKEAMRNPTCNNCGGPAILGNVTMEEHHLRVENARLKDELNRISLLAHKFLGRPISSLAGPFHPHMPNSGLELGVGRNGFNGIDSVDTTFPIGLDSKEGIMGNMSMIAANNMGPIQGVDLPFDKSCLPELALRALDELVKLAQSDDQMWVRGLDGERETLNNEEYIRTNPPCIGLKPEGFVTEATKATGMVIMSSLCLVERLMDPNQWADMFPCLLGRASIIDVLFGGMTVGSRNGALQLMHAEFQALSPLVPVRHMKFLRFSKQLAEGLWAIVDVSIDGNRESSDAPTYFGYRRLPSGCIIQDMPNGYSKVTWVEHTEYDESSVHNLYRPLISSGLGFGAQRWLAALQRQCECLAFLTSPISSDDNSGVSLSGKRSMTKMAHRMTRDFCAGVCGTVHMWQQVQLGNLNPDTRLLIHSSTDTAYPSGLLLSATSSVWIPVTHQALFNFLRDEQLRSEWDELSYGGQLQEMIHIPKGPDRASCVSLLRVTASNANQNTVLILQETQTDESGSTVIYAPININTMQMVLTDGDSAIVSLLPSGFAIVPDGPDKGSGGSLLTVSFQILVNNLPSAKLTMESVETVNSLITRSIQRIKTALHCN